MADDTARERRRAYHREYQRKWREANRELAREVSREASRRYRSKFPEAEARDRRRYEKMRAHGANAQAVFAAFWGSQGGCCYLCGDPFPAETPSEAHIDHSHDCCPCGRSCDICRRGLACGRCNKLIGLADDDPVRLRRIADALEAANRIVAARLSGRPVQEVMF